MTDHIMPASNCPACGHRFDRAASATGKDDGPQPHDFTVCIQCAEILIFDDELKVRRLNGKEVLRIAFDSELAANLAKAQYMIRALRALLN